MVAATSTSAKSRIVEAAVRLVARGGIAEASLRKVADESGINIGSVRYHFGTAEGLLVATAEEIGARMSRRLDSALPEPVVDRYATGPRGLVEDVCRAVLPVSESDRPELIVLVELIHAARLRPEFRTLSTRMGDDLRAVLRRVLEAVRVPDATMEAERLNALVGGLTFELVYPHGSHDPDTLFVVLRRHIAGIVPA
ncbi:TetR family transcriptional regulator C-terminal domain-containing protein [Saccharopolyspora sp. HNM0986]|uniref:TetR/AcrR family transcriptional regulator n=1 Tax=Saccharopolyspora galaxeae TaxID=2781241 RepID=UPI00190BCD9C|nr:TetR family transcriptional regulator C-terminal domain-containing protein [Saccharopolyspora sp. HNM0986]MBK0868981.1 TetR family transcriptional regulator C-terminal domain-containing protein [Saccharopolyspora sp. HNM0986]